MVAAAVAAVVAVVAASVAAAAVAAVVSRRTPVALTFMLIVSLAATVGHESTHDMHTHTRALWHTHPG